MKKRNLKKSGMVLAAAVLVTSLSTAPAFAETVSEENTAVTASASTEAEETVATKETEDEIITEDVTVFEKEADQTEEESTEQKAEDKQAVTEAQDSPKEASSENKTSEKKETTEQAETKTTAKTKTSAKVQSATVVKTDYSKLAVAKLSKGEKLNVRRKAKKSSKIIAYMENGAVATVLKKEGKWVKIKSSSVTGYVRANYLVMGNEKAVKAVETRVAYIKKKAKVRRKASLKSKKIASAKKGQTYSIVSTKKKGFVRILINGKKGYVKASCVTIKPSYKTAKKISKTVSASSVTKHSTSSGEQVVDYALKFVGNRYVYGGSSLTRGTDCSGFVMSVYKHYGISLPHSSSAQRSVGRKVKISEIKAGDIICYSGHVAIYMGNGKIVHASNPRTGIKVSNNAFYRKVITIRRVL